MRYYPISPFFMQRLKKIDKKNSFVKKPADNSVDPNVRRNTIKT